MARKIRNDTKFKEENRGNLVKGTSQKIQLILSDIGIIRNSSY